jgi:hypothetical protein
MRFRPSLMQGDQLECIDHTCELLVNPMSQDMLLAFMTLGCISYFQVA